MRITTRTGRRLRCGRAEQDHLCLRWRPQALPAGPGARGRQPLRGDRRRAQALRRRPGGPPRGLRRRRRPRGRRLRAQGPVHGVLVGEWVDSQRQARRPLPRLARPRGQVRPPRRAQRRVVDRRLRGQAGRLARHLGIGDVRYGAPRRSRPSRSSRPSTSSATRFRPSSSTWSRAPLVSRPWRSSTSDRAARCRSREVRDDGQTTTTTRPRRLATRDQDGPGHRGPRPPQVVRQAGRPRRHRPRRPRGHRVRAARPERGRQDDGDPHPLDADRRRRRRGAHRRVRRRARARTRSAA